MRYIKTDWYQWHDTHASLVVQVDWHRLLVPENWSVCMALNLPERCSVLSYAEEVEADITAKMLSVEVEGKSTSNFQGIVPLSTEYKQHDLYRKVHV